uniref:Uncharacterized protein n=1 Tax=Photinus pyralis TaxID=7054 RepID=A0A1Y1MUT5_PHOPY
MKRCSIWQSDWARPNHVAWENWKLNSLLVTNLTLTPIKAIKRRALFVCAILKLVNCFVYCHAHMNSMLNALINGCGPTEHAQYVVGTPQNISTMRSSAATRKFSNTILGSCKFITILILQILRVLCSAISCQ